MHYQAPHHGRLACACRFSYHTMFHWKLLVFTNTSSAAQKFAFIVIICSRTRFRDCVCHAFFINSRLTWRCYSQNECIDTTYAWKWTQGFLSALRRIQRNVDILLMMNSDSLLIAFRPQARTCLQDDIIEPPWQAAREGKINTPSTHWSLGCLDAISKIQFSFF